MLVPSSPICAYYSTFSAWLFLSNICNGIKKKCIQQPYISTCHSGTTTATCSSDQRQEKQLSMLSQERASNVDNGNSDTWAPAWKANEMQSIPHEVSHKQHPAQEQREAESFWIREQPCGHCKAERLQQWLHQHFIKPSEKNSSLDEDVWQEPMAKNLQVGLIAPVTVGITFNFILFSST
uniref:Uncharacterized protein n=1 Tax=Pavo cristatus TaxID=9049 RepID=A0A8C9EXF8_PAVCR